MTATWPTRARPVPGSWAPRDRRPTAPQVDDIYRASSGGSTCGAKRLLTLGSPGVGGATIATADVAGFGHGLLQHDMAERFLLHYFAVSAHAYTRGSAITPESSDVSDRDAAPAAYTAAGVTLAPIYLKWMLCFEEPESRTLWLAKATPRDWLAPGEAPLVASRLSTRYGRVAFSLVPTDGAGGFAVRANVTLPPSFGGGGGPAGGVRLRIRAPLAHAGKMSGVSVGGKAWSSFSAAEETVTFSPADVGTDEQRRAMQTVVVRFG